MRKLIYLTLPLMLQACAANSMIDIRVKVEPSHEVSAETATKIALMWALKHGEDKPVMNLRVEKRSAVDIEECLKWEADTEKFCRAVYAISVVNPDRKCVSEEYPVAETFDAGKCGYEIGWKSEEIICW